MTTSYEMYILSSMVSPDRLELYYLTPDIPCQTPEQVSKDIFDDPLKKSYQTYQTKYGLGASKLIQWNSWVGIGREIHSGMSRFTPLTVPDEYRMALLIAVHGWGRTIPPDRQVAIITESSSGDRRGVALFISEDPFDPSSRELLALANDGHFLYKEGSIWIADSHYKEATGMPLINAVQEAKNRIRYVDQSLTLP